MDFQVLGECLKTISSQGVDTKNHPLVVFDLDGVLVETKRLHIDALNEALREECSGVEITWSEHLSRYDGMPTDVKLEMLVAEGRMERSSIPQVKRGKQKKTEQALSKLSPNPILVEIVRELKERGAVVGVASNSVRSTVDLVLKRLGLEELADFALCNEDVSNPKPHPEIYWKSMALFGKYPGETFVLEDSAVGRRAAQLSGANLIAVDKVSDLATLNIAETVFRNLSERRDSMPPWKASDLNILIPMAGAGSRFSEAGYTFPKPLIEIKGRAMIEQVVRNLHVEGNFIFLVRREHLEEFNLEPYLRLLAEKVEIVVVDALTEGAACTALLASDLIDSETPLLIANSDQIIDWDSSQAMYAFSSPEVDGGILTFESNHPKWSFARVDSDEWVCEVAEKKPISNRATVGVYYWSRGSDFVRYANQMIEKDIRTNGEFYICPVYNEAIADGKKIKNKAVDRMWGIGTPEDLREFLADSEAIRVL